MGLFNFIFGKPVIIENSFFGQMRFAGNKKDFTKSYFECSRYFKPKNDVIEIHMSAGVEGPSQKQIEFFENLENNYTEISNSITPLIEEEFRNWKENFKILDFKKEFKPVFLSIPICEEQPIIWEIAFESDHD